MKPELTIILLLKERQSYTSRFIEYFLKNNLGYNLFISDGSKRKLEPKILNKIKKIPRLLIESLERIRITIYIIKNFIILANGQNKVCLFCM